MKQTMLVVVFGSLMGMGIPSMAVPPGMTIEFTKSPMGKVIFDGNTHPMKGVMCDGCHPAIFQQKKGTAQIKLADHEAGQKFCFACHNGKKAWATKDNCNKCHVK